MEKSEPGLIQRRHGRGDPWRIGCICILMRQTEWRQVENVLAPLFRLYPCSSALAEAHHEDVADVARPTGLHNRKARDLIEFSRQTTDGVPFDSRTGIGAYGRDCYALICRGDIFRSGVRDWALLRWQQWAQESCERAVIDAIGCASAR